MAAVKWAPSDPVKVWIGLSGLATAAGVFGITVRQRRALLASLHERATRLEFERDQEGRLAAAAERNRIAREMHDVVSHNLSVMVALADGASYAAEASPEQAAQATRQISATGRDALLEMRSLLGILRDDLVQRPLEPQPRLGELHKLVERVRAAGVPVRFDIDGDPTTLPEGIQLPCSAWPRRRSPTPSSTQPDRLRLASPSAAIPIVSSSRPSTPALHPMIWPRRSRRPRDA